VLTIPGFDGEGALPPGVHWANWEEFKQRFGINPHRKNLIRGLRDALICLQWAGCKTVYLDGSFVTAKISPSDFDGCWDPDGVDPALLDPILLKFDNERFAQKVKYRGELFVASLTESTSGLTFLEFFQQDKNSSRAKGIIALNLQGVRL